MKTKIHGGKGKDKGELAVGSIFPVTGRILQTVGINLAKEHTARK